MTVPARTEREQAAVAEQAGAAPGERLVRELGTSHIRTAVLAVPGGGFVWARRPGPARGAPLVRAAEPAAALLRAVSTGAPARVAPPEPGTGDVLRYHLPGPFSAARLLHDPQARTQTAVREALRAVGATLRRLHAVPAPAGLPEVPPGPARLTRWLGTGEGPGEAARLHAAATARLGARRTELLRAWGAAAAAGTGPRVLLHGGPALGTLVLPTRGGRPALQSGEELTSGCWEFDVAWLLAECAELARGVSRGIGGVPVADYAALGAALVEGYGRSPSRGAVLRARALRILTHAHDFAAYVSWHDELLVYLDLVAEAVAAAEAAPEPVGHADRGRS